MKNIFFLTFSLLSGGHILDSPAFIDPTGTYILKGEVKNSKIISHYGEIRVRLLDSNTVALCFYINKGYPGYESGSLVDTLRYEENRATYHPANDSSCAIYFAFDWRSAAISKELSDPHSGCGFRPDVMVPAVFDKTSSEIPVIQDLSQHGSF
jgi:hypothetical protein